MRITLDDEFLRKEIFDLFQIFFEDDEFSFCDQGNIRILWKEKILIFNGREFLFEKKQELKQLLYRNLVESTGEESPWGLLTGVRPVKLARMLTEKYGKTKAKEILKEDYFLWDEKIENLFNIYDLEETLIPQENREGIHCYFHIPFCDTRCSYCSYPTMITGKNRMNLENYLSRLKREIEELAFYLPKEKLQSLYIGGGTPTALNAVELEDLLNEIRKYFPQDVEFTVEAGREDSLDVQKLKILKDYGVTRICLNPQSFHEESLQAIGRPFDKKQFFRMYDKILELDFPVVNMDFILGLPKETRNTFEKTLRILEEMNPENITFHTLSLKRGSLLYDQAKEFKEETAKLWGMVESFVREKNYHPYYLYRQKRILGNFENTGYSKKGKECLYNMVMTDELSSIIAFGQGTNSKFIGRDFHRQVQSPKNIKDYILQDDYIEEKKEILRSFYG